MSAKRGRKPDLTRLTLEGAARALRARQLSCLELAEACLARIERLEPTLNAFITVTADLARDQARGADRDLARSRDRGILHGIPIALKDLYETAGVRTTAGSALLRDSVSATDATTVARLRAGGAVLIGKTNLHEWAFGVTNNNPHYGPTRNPYDTERIPGGSSGGSAVALAAGECLGALGTDTGGSIRIPASLCGVVGLKPSYGRVSVRGVLPLAWTLDHAGPMARTVRDAAHLLQVIAGHDPADALSADVPVDDTLARIEEGVRGMRVAVPTDFFFTGCDPAVEGAVRLAIAVLERAGARLAEVAVPFARELQATQRTLITTDAYAIHAEDLRRRPKLYGADVRQRLRAGARVSGADYARARRLREDIRAGFDELFREHDVLVAPTTPAPAPRRRGSGAVQAAVKLTSLTSPFNLTGLPAISIPCGATPEGLPIGLQIAGGRWREATVLRVARAYERATDWHLRVPELDAD